MFLGSRSARRSAHVRAGLGVSLAAALAGLVGACSDDVALTDARPQIDAAIPGQLMLSWTVGHAGSSLTCADVGASTVAVDIVHDGDAFGVVDTFSCGSAMGLSRMLAPGLYHLRFNLSGTGGTLDGPENVRNLTVPPGAIANAPPVAFDVDPTGGLTFRITTPPAGGNCAPTGSGGAGITAQRIELRNSTGACVPALFEIGAGAMNPAATYASDCSGSTTACIAADQDVTVTGLRSGSYSMVMIGSVGGAACWRRQPNATVPAAGRTATLPAQQLALQAGVPGCPTM